MAVTQPILTIEKVGAGVPPNIKLSWTEKPGERYALMRKDSLSDEAWKLGEKESPTYGNEGYYRVEVGATGETEFPGSTDKCIQRIIAQRADGLNAFGYPIEGGWRIAFFRDMGEIYTTDIPLDWTLGVEMAFSGEKLFIVSADIFYGSVREITVSNDWPPVIGESYSVHEFDSPPSEEPHSIRWPGACGLQNGKFVAVWYLQVGTGLKTLTAYRNSAGEWSEQVSDLYGSVYSTQRAGWAVPVQHPADGTLWIFGIKDSWGILTAHRYSAGSTLNSLGTVHISNCSPVDGVYDPYAIHPEVPENFRVIADGDKLRVLVNAREFITCPAPGFLSVTHLLTHTIDAVGNKANLAFTNLWTERLEPDYAWVVGKIYMFSVPPTSTTWPSKFNNPLLRDDNNQTVSIVDQWLPIAAGRKELIYPRGGKLWLNRL